MDNQSLSRTNLIQSYYKTKENKKHGNLRVIKACQRDLATNQIITYDFK